MFQPLRLPFFVFENYNNLSYFVTIQQVEGTEQLRYFYSYSHTLNVL